MVEGAEGPVNIRVPFFVPFRISPYTIAYYTQRHNTLLPKKSLYAYPSKLSEIPVDKYIPFSKSELIVTIKWYEKVLEHMETIEDFQYKLEPFILAEIIICPSRYSQDPCTFANSYATSALKWFSIIKNALRNCALSSSSNR